MHPMETTKDQYRALLDRSYRYYVGRTDLAEQPSRLDFVGKAIFGLFTGDTEVMELLAGRALEIVAALLAGKTKAYLTSPAVYHWYLVLMNTAFFAQRVTWRESLRVAAFDPSCTEDFTSEYFVDVQGASIYTDAREPDRSPLYLHEGRWVLFMQAVLEFAAVQPNKASAFDSAPSTWKPLWLAPGQNLRITFDDFADGDDAEEHEWDFKVTKAFNLTEVHLELLKALCPGAVDYGEPGNLYSGTYLSALCQQMHQLGVVEDTRLLSGMAVDMQIHFALTTDVDLAIYNHEPTARILAAFRY